jgi:hypothetical protein
MLNCFQLIDGYGGAEVIFKNTIQYIILIQSKHYLFMNMLRFATI